MIAIIIALSHVASYTMPITPGTVGGYNPSKA